MEVSVSSVVERNVSVNPLGVCDLEQFQNELLGPVLPVEIATRHCEVEGLYCVEMHRDVSFGEISPPY
jgi:hypothetical protein